MGLTDKQQAVVMAAVFIIPSVATWMGLGFPTDRVALGILGSSVLSGFLAMCKELLGGTAPTPAPQEAT